MHRTRNGRQLRFGGWAVAIVGVLAIEPEASAFRPNQDYGHRGITRRSLDRFEFADPELGGTILHFTTPVRDLVISANEGTDGAGLVRNLACFLDASADERRLPPFFVTAFHCDDDQIGECSRVVSEGIDTIVTTIMAQNVDKARACLGSTLHTLQDFYAHTSLVWRLFLGNQANYQTPLSTDIGRTEREGMFNGTHSSSASIIGSAYGSAACRGSVPRTDIIVLPVVSPIVLSRDQYTGHEFVPAPPAVPPLVSGYFPSFAAAGGINGVGFTPNPVDVALVASSRWEPPPDRCGHGLTPPDIPVPLTSVIIPEFEVTPGMAMDVQNKPTGWQHRAAVELAEIATLELLNAVRDEVVRRLSVNSTALSETMRKFMGHAPVANTPILTNFGAAVDLSSSMEPVLLGITDEVNRFTEAATMAAGGDPTLVIVPYSDPQIGAPLIARDPEAFRQGINSLVVGSLGGGGDCPERTIAALQSVVDTLPRDSRAFAFTNSSSKDVESRQALIKAAQDKNITVDINVSGSCSPIDPAYREITEGTGGQLMQTLKDDSEGPRQLMAIELENLFAGEQQIILRQSKLAGASESVVFPVDSSVRRLSLSIDMSGTEIVDLATAQKGTFRLLDPAGTEVPARVDGLVGASFTVEAPARGIWTLAIDDGEGLPYTLVVRAHSELALRNVQFAEYQGRLGHSGILPILDRPLVDEPSQVMAHFSDPDAARTEFQVFSLDGAVLGSFEVAANENLDGLIGTVVPPSQPFRIGVSGQRADGSEFRRVHARTFAASPYRISPIEDGAVFVPGRANRVRLLVYNFGETATLAVRASDTLGSSFEAVPEEFELGTGASQLVELEVDVPEGLPFGTFSRLTARVGAAEDDPNENTSELVRLIDEDGDGDGVANVLEQGPSGDIVGYDGNGDGQSDAEQRTLLSLPLFAGQYATLEVPSALRVTGLDRDLLTPDANLPDEAVVPLGVFRMSARLSGDQTQDISLYLPDASPYPFQGLATAQLDGPWQLSGGFEARAGRFRAQLTDDSAGDLDTNRDRVSFLLGPAYGLAEGSSEPAGCGCRAAPSGQRGVPSSAMTLLALAGLAWRRQRVCAARRRTVAARAQCPASSASMRDRSTP